MRQIRLRGTPLSWSSLPIHDTYWISRKRTTPVPSSSRFQVLAETLRWVGPTCPKSAGETSPQTRVPAQPEQKAQNDTRRITIGRQDMCRNQFRPSPKHLSQMTWPECSKAHKGRGAYKSGKTCWEKDDHHTSESFRTEN